MPSMESQPIPLAELCHIQLGYNVRGRLQPGGDAGRLAVQMRDIDAEGTLDFQRLGRFALPSLPERYLAHPGEVLFRPRGDHTTATALGDDLPEPAIVILPLIILRPKTKKLDPQFLAWIINQPRAQRHFAGGAQGQNLRMIPRPCLESLAMDLPNLAAQRTIVTVGELSDREARLAIRLANLKHQRIAAALADAARRHAMEPA
jgi:hypothetical protein